MPSNERRTTRRRPSRVAALLAVLALAVASTLPATGLAQETDGDTGAGTGGQTGGNGTGGDQTGGETGGETGADQPSDEAPLQEGGQGGEPETTEPETEDERDGGAREEDGRTTGLTLDLRLSRAEIESEDLEDDEEEFVVYEFEDRVVEINDESGFYVRGSTSDEEVASESARLVRDEDDQVLVEFPEDTNLDQLSLAGIDTDTVRDAGGDGNPPDTVELAGASGRDRTSAGPELEDVDTDETLDRVRYRFDEDLDDEDGSADASAFGFRTRSGRTTTGSDVVGFDDDEIVIEFDDAVQDGERFYAEGGAVTDQAGNDSLPGSTGGDTALPELSDVNSIGRTQFDYRFTEDVDEIEPDRFEVYTDAGDVFTGEDWSRVSSRTVRIVFSDIEDFDEDLVWAAVDVDAVRDASGSDSGNTIGGERIGSKSNRSSGPTTGPDLERARADDDTGEVTFVFDEDVDDDLSPDPAAFQVVTVEGDLVQGRSFIEIDDDEVVIRFDRNVVDAADGFLVEAGAVEDNSGQPNPTATTSESGRRSESGDRSSTRDDDDSDDDSDSNDDDSNDDDSDNDNDDNDDNDSNDDDDSNGDGNDSDASGTSSSGDGSSTDASSYTVVRGDTLWNISQRYGTTVQAIVDANGIPDPDLIFPGQVFVIPR
ncbi:LysM domain-containing protein [Egicoccus sp. AB-alg2]|uniref:LysM peptidoglycan-binding domain-containing protein n=1 Tax=Egicoccus sp. AB-alg2 TaxID=3242693 RepID=UPI00359CEB6F